MIRIELHSAGWTRVGGTRVSGSAWFGEGYLDANQLAERIDRTPSESAWIETIGGLNGCFAIVTERDGRALAAVDRVRSIPLFYVLGESVACISDNAYTAMDARDFRILEPIADLEFRLTGYVTGQETLIRGLAQVQAGEVVWIGGRECRRHRYYKFEHRDSPQRGTTELVERLHAVHERVFRRLIGSTRDRTLVVPLSGGYDSRLIAVWLRELGATGVVCYSYGVPGNWESRISRELALYLGFRWEFIRYSPERWRAWSSTDRFGEYFREAGNLTSVPHLQDWPAVFELKEDGRVPADSVFVPGHSGDFLAGSHIPADYASRTTISRREILDSIHRAHYSLWDWPADPRCELRDAFDKRIESVVGALNDGSTQQAADVFERWDLQERQAKFICNAVRVYDHFGYAWRLPLFDHELMDFWAQVPLALRIGRGLYFEYVRQRQALPVSAPNVDRGALSSALVRGLVHSGLNPLAKRARRWLRRRGWRRVHANSPLAWLELVDRDDFSRTYTGKELFHSYMVLKYSGIVHSLVAQTENA